jgi:hypothetical protein
MNRHLFLFGLLGGLCLGLPGLARAERAAVGRQPAATKDVARGITDRIRAINVPQRFKRGAQRVLRQALKLRPGPKDRSDAVIEHDGLDRAWISFTGRKGGIRVQKYVSVNRSTGGNMHSRGVTYQTSVTHRDGYKRSLWREVNPLNNGAAVETVHYTRYQVEKNTEGSLGGGALKYYLLGPDGNRLMPITQDQALTLKLQHGYDRR